MKTEAEQVVAELTAATLKRVGAGTYRIVFGSAGWVVKGPRSFRNSVAIVIAARLVETLRDLADQRPQPSGWRAPGLALDPASREGRSRTALRHTLVATIRAGLTVIPEPLWRSAPAARQVREANLASARSAELAGRLEGAGLMPPRLQLPATRVRTPWRPPFQVTVAFRRVDRTFAAHLRALASAQSDDEIDALLDGFLECQVRLWHRGVFSMDIVPFANYGMLEGRLVLLDDGSLTDDPLVIRRFLDGRAIKLAYIEAVLAALLSRERAFHFRERMGRLVTPVMVRRHWPAPEDLRWQTGAGL